MGKWRTGIEILANIALLLCCILLGGFLIRTYLLRNKQEAKPNPPTPTSLVGKKLSFDSIDWKKNERTLLLVLQKECRFCDESAPFYQRLTKELSNHPKTHLVAVLPHSNDENKQYLKEKQIDIADVRQASPRSIGVRGTPTLILVDSTGTVLEQWNGKLPAAEEDVVISRLKQ